MFDRARLAINPHRVAHSVRIGPEPHHEVMVIDDFYADPAYVRELALSLDYEDRGRLPIRASITLDNTPILEAIRELVHPGLEVMRDFRGFVFSVMDERSAPTLRHFPHPHVDEMGSGAATLSCIIYLNLPDQCRGGTAFYRHRATELCEHHRELTPALARYMMERGISSVDKAHAAMTHVSDDERARLAARPGEWGYITDSTDEWELAGMAEMRFNRCVVYDALFYHNPYMHSGDFGHTPDTRRLTQTLFFELPASAAVQPREATAELAERAA